MNTLTTTPVAPLLERLFAESDASDPATTPSVAAYWNGLASEEKERLIRSRTDTGRVFILDPRILTKSYGRLFLKSLPECRLQIDDGHSVEDADEQGRRPTP